MNSTTSNTGSKPITLADLERAMREIGLVAMPKEWTLVAPDGRVWRGEPMDLFMVLAQYHPLLQLPKVPW